MRTLTREKKKCRGYAYFKSYMLTFDSFLFPSCSGVGLLPYANDVDDLLGTSSRPVRQKTRAHLLPVWRGDSIDVVRPVETHLANGLVQMSCRYFFGDSSVSI